MKRAVLTSPTLGVYLGSCLGLGFWSKLDPAGQEEAAGFDSEDEALAFVKTWDHPVEDVTVVLVEAAGIHPTRAECVAAGLPDWDSQA